MRADRLIVLLFRPFLRGRRRAKTCYLGAEICGREVQVQEQSAQNSTYVQYLDISIGPLALF